MKTTNKSKAWGSIGLIIFFAVAWYASKLILAPANLNVKIAKCQQVMIDGDSTNSESISTFNKFDTMIQNSEYPVQFKREVSNCDIWLSNRQGESRNEFVSDTNKVFNNITTALDEVSSYYKTKQVQDNNS